MTTTEDVQTFTTADGTRLALHWQGPREAPLTLVFCHGWTLDSRIWEPIIGPLASRHPNLRLLCHDLRGHGRSDPTRPGSATIAQLADDLADLLRGPVGGPVVLAGHSMGGMAIMALAERHPDLVARRVAGVTFVATSCGELIPLDLRLHPGLAWLVSRAEPRLMRGNAVGRLLRAQQQTATRVGLIRPGVRWLLFGTHPRRADLDLTARCIAQCRPGNIVDFRPTFDDHSRAAALAAFAGIPALVLAGTLDRLIPVRHAGTLAAHLPHATVVRYAGAGHMVHLERAEQLTQRISELVTVALRG